MSKPRFFTHVEKGGKYRLVCGSMGAASLRGETRIVYVDTVTLQHYHRTQADWDKSMVPWEKPEHDPEVPLKRGVLNCPNEGTKLHFEQIHGMRVARDGFLNARCPDCKAEFRVEPNEPCN
jgi:hypothetical protein